MDSGSQTLLVQEIHRQLRLASRREVLISYMWMRERSTNDGNELVDVLAKQAAISHKSFDYDLIPISYLKKVINDNALQIWNERWISSEVGGTTRKYFPTVYDRIKCKKYFVSNFYLTQFMTNHGKFAKYLTRFGVENNSNCSTCIG
jgi:hypothetical protein